MITNFYSSKCIKSLVLAFLISLFYYPLIAQIPAGYYDAANGKTGSQLKSALNDIISGHTTYPYSSSGTDVWDILKTADQDPNNSANVIGIYSGFSMDAAAEYNNGDGWNREHVWAKSRGDFGTSEGPGTDCHHLAVADISTNSARGNRNFGYGDSYYNDTQGFYSGSTLSKTSSTQDVWEPRDEVKGDVARMMFYMATRYEGENGDIDLELTETLLGSGDKSPLHAKLSILLEWHQQDPVSAAEIQRNEVIYSYQNNRNPFIDHPEYVCEIYSCSTSGGNNAPYFTSSPVTSVEAGNNYSYTITTTDSEGDNVSIAATTLPNWMNFTDNGNGAATISGSTQATGDYPVSLNASDGSASNTQNFTVRVTTSGGGSGIASELFFSEYIEGSSYNKGLEIANFTGSSVNLSSYSIMKQTNGSGSWGGELNLNGTIANEGVFVVVNASASSTMQSEADISSGGPALSFNGNDPIGLFKNGQLVDVLGNFNSSSNFAQNTTLVRKETVASPTTNYTSVEWDSYPSDTFSFLGTHSIAGSGTEPSLDCSSSVSTFPYQEGFEFTSSWKQSTNDDFNWSINSGGTPSSNTGPSSAFEGTNYFYVESSSPNYSNKTAIIESPCFDLSTENQASFSFNHHLYGANTMGSLQLEITTDGDNWTSIWSMSGNQGSQWQSTEVDLSAYAGENIQLRFVGQTADTWQGDMAIDNLELATAQPPVETTLNLALTFDNYPEETTWEIVEGSTVIAEGGPYGNYADGSTVNIPIVVPEGCYDFIIYDAYGDGICCSYGSGSYTLSENSVAIASGGSFGSGESTSFCVGNSNRSFSVTKQLSSEKEPEGFNVYPNPAISEVEIFTGKMNASSYEFVSLAGEIVQSGNLNAKSSKIKVTTLKTGIYILKVRDTENLVVRKIMVK